MLKINKTVFQKARLPIAVSLFVFGGFVLFGALSYIPGQSFANTTGNATVSVDVKSVLTLTVSPDAEEDGPLSIVADSKTVKTGVFTATVSSNQQYKISLSTNDTSTALTRDGSNETIPAVGAGALVASGTNAWGVRACMNASTTYNCGAGSTALDVNPYKAIGEKGFPVEFYRSGASGGTDLQTNFEVGIGVASDLSSGEYTNHVVVTAAQF